MDTLLRFVSAVQVCLAVSLWTTVPASAAQDGDAKILVIDGKIVRVDDPEMKPADSGSGAEHRGLVDLGLGICFPEVDGSTNAGMDFILGYEGYQTENWNIGGQVHIGEGTFLPDSTFNAFILNATARPRNSHFDWLQFKAGIESTSYTRDEDVYVPYLGLQKQRVADWSGTGYTFGAGIVFAGSSFLWHVFDIEQHFVGGHRFTTYSVSIIVIAEILH